MSNKQNLAEELIENWQTNMQKTFQDPKIIELMTNNISQMKDLINTYETNFKQSSEPSTNDNDGVDQLNQLKQRVDSIEARLSILEKYVTANSGSDSK